MLADLSFCYPHSVRTVSVDTTDFVAVDSFETVKTAMSELRTECAGFESFVVGMLDLLEEMRVELAESEGCLEVERQGIEEQHGELEQMREDICRTQTNQLDFNNEIEDLREKLMDSQAALESEHRRAAANEREKDDVRDRLDELEKEQDRLRKERNELRTERDATIADLENASNAVAQIEAYGRQLNDTRKELESVRTELSHAYEKLDRTHDSSQQLGDQQFAEYEEEREALEAELELARRRAAELSNAIAEQRKQLKEERNGWSDELRQLRALLETRSAYVPEREPLSTKVTAAVDQPDVVGTAASSDPVVGSVLAQFAQLQKDAAARRAKR